MFNTVLDEVPELYAALECICQEMLYLSIPSSPSACMVQWICVDFILHVYFKRSLEVNGYCSNSLLFTDPHVQISLSDHVVCFNVTSQLLWNGSSAIDHCQQWQEYWTDSSGQCPRKHPCHWCMAKKWMICRNTERSITLREDSRVAWPEQHWFVIDHSLIKHAYRDWDINWVCQCACCWCKYWGYQLLQSEFTWPLSALWDTHSYALWFPLHVIASGINKRVDVLNLGQGICNWILVLLVDHVGRWQHIPGTGVIDQWPVCLEPSASTRSCSLWLLHAAAPAGGAQEARASCLALGWALLNIQYWILNPHCFAPSPATDSFFLSFFPRDACMLLDHSTARFEENRLAMIAPCMCNTNCNPLYKLPS